MSLNNAQYDAIMRDYQLLQAQHRHEQMDRIEEAFARIPRLSQIDAEIASKSVSGARKLLSGDNNALILLKNELRLLSQERRALLIEGGYSEDHLELHYTCPDCKDTGYIGNHKCRCFKQAAINLLYTQSNLTEILDKENFDTLSYDYYPADLYDNSGKTSSLAAFQKAVSVSRQFVEDFDTTPSSNLFFYGDTGMGKTFLSHCIARELLETTHSVIYFSAQELFDLLAQERFSKDHTDHQNDTSSMIYECDLLIIDDLGSEITNAFNISELFSCLNERKARGKAMVISTNIPLDQFRDRYSDRIFSRISTGFMLLKLFGKDIRMQKKLNALTSKGGKY